jgi:GNAT superfamily N-acetyltransferase
MRPEFTIKLPPYSNEFVEDLTTLACRVFGSAELEYNRWRMANMPDFTVFCAWHNRQLVAFKAGYAMTQTKYYSWLGGVHPDFRRHGIAAQLMERQHAWLAEHGFSAVETSVDQENLAMAQVNLRHGFRVYGVRAEPHRTQILYYKDIAGLKH